MIRFGCGDLIATLLAVGSIPVAAESTCEEIRAGIDIGSGTTKMVIARVDVCSLRIKSVLAPRPGERIEVPVEWKKNIVQTGQGKKTFRPGTEAAGLVALAKMKAIGLAHGAKQFSAVATSAFRRVSEDYAADLQARIREQFGIPVHIVEQSEEARLGFLAAIVKLGLSRTEAVVWDIGGGSMQISYWNEANRRVEAYEGRFANNAMQAFVTEQLQGKPPGTEISPNPISTAEQKNEANNHVLAAIRKAEEVATATGSSEHRALFRTFPLVIGIGGVHFYSNCEITKRDPGCEITREKLQADILAYSDLTDEQLVTAGRASHRKYASKRITAGALTVGFMKAFGFERIRSLNIDMADGVLIDPSYWQ